MSVLVDVEDDAWRSVSGLEGLAEGAVGAALRHEGRHASESEVSVLFTNNEEAARINEHWRNKSYAPNVLSFPAHRGTSLEPGAPAPLGDIVLAAGIVEREAREQEK